MTRARARLLGPCFKTGRVGGRPNATDPRVPELGSGPGTPVTRGRRALRSSPRRLSRTTGAGRPSLRAGTVDPRSPQRAVRAPGALTSDAETDASYSRVFRPPGNRSWRCARGKCTRRDAPAGEPVRKRDPETPPTARRRLVEFHEPNLRIHPFASRRFHVLLNSLFKVLFNFPSRYLSAIGLVSVFSLRWSLPPALGCIPKQPDSEDAQSYRAECR